MSGSVSSYDQLVKQVEALKRENSHLRRELEDNSNHLSKLENETSDMKEVLKQLQGKLEQEAKTLVSTGRSDVLDQLKELQMDITSLYEFRFQSHVPNLVQEEGPLPGQVAEGGPTHSGVLQKTKECGGSKRETIKHLEELDKERYFLLSEIEKEEKEKLWYYTQLRSLSKRLDELPRIETFSMQMDLIRQQLEFEARHIHTLMEERFGTSDEMVQRAQIRATRLEQIKEELQEAQEKIQQTKLQVCGKPNHSETDSIANNPPHIEEPNHLGSKVEMVFWILSMLATRDKDDMSRTLLAMSSSQESCVAMRKSGCLPLLIQLLHDMDRDLVVPESSSATPASRSGCSKDARTQASAALHNIIYSQPDEGQAKKEMRVLHVLEQIRSYCETCWEWMEMYKQGGDDPGKSAAPTPIEPQICQAMCAIMKLSFDEEYRRAMNELGGLQAVGELLQVDFEMHGMTNDPLNLALRRYAGMALTNLTFGDVVNKATLCSKKGCMQAIVAQLGSESEELQQVVSSIIRNLSWRADINSKKVLRDVGSVSGLMQCALRATKEPTLKSLLSALWNLSAHSTDNKVAICSVDGALAFLVSTLTYKCQSNSLAIIESGGGILRNVSSLIATREDYRQILRDHNCLQTLLQHLKSHSLTIVSNACGTLWNLSARSSKDQELLWDLGAVSMLRNLIHSKHKMIAMGSAAALRNLLSNRPLKYKDAAVISPGSCMPSLYMRKQKALEAELDAKHLAETFESIEKQSPKNPSINKPLRHIENLVKDYASDSGCFDDDEAPNVSTGLETGSLSVLSMFLNSSFLQGQGMPRGIAQRKCTESEVDLNVKEVDPKKLQTSDDEVSLAAEQLANKISTTVAKIDKLVEDISTMHTSSEDSFSLSSEDHCIDWQYGSDELHETRAKSCSPCRLSDSSTFVKRESLSRAHPLLRLKTAYTSLSNDSLNSGSTSDGYCTKEQVKPSQRTSFVEYKAEVQMCQKRPDQLDLKNPQQQNYHTLKCSSEPNITTIKLSPSYQRVSLTQSFGKGNIISGSEVSRCPPNMFVQKQAWLPSNLAQVGETLDKPSQNIAVCTPTLLEPETAKKFSVEDTPICFSRCSSLSSLSSADNILDGQSHSENEIDSDSSLEIIEVEETCESLFDDKIEDEQDVTKEISTKPNVSQPIEIPSQKQQKVFIGDSSPSRNEDMTPSSSSENYIQETPLVMSRCSSVSSLGSFESPSIASSIQSDPCSEMISGTISPSELPDSPGQTMPPSRSKTPSFEPIGQPEKENNQFNIQWENNIKRFLEIADFKERFQFPPDIDSMIYFTVEKPNENFSCASSLSALPLHEHYIQKDVELKLMHSLQEKNCLNFVAHEKAVDILQESALERTEKPDSCECNSDDDIEILKECINSAMPSKFRKVKSSLISTLSTHVLNSQTKKSLQLPVYMLVPAQASLGISKKFGAERDTCRDDSSFTDSAEGTPVNFSSAASLSDETLQYPLKDNTGLKDQKPFISKKLERRDLMPVEGHCTEDIQASSNIGNLVKTNIGNLVKTKNIQGNTTNMSKIKQNVLSSVTQKTSSIYNAQDASSISKKHSSSQISKNYATDPINIGRKDQNAPQNFPKLDLYSGSQSTNKKNEVHHEKNKKLDVGYGEYINGSYAFQSFCHTTPTEEAVYCFYENESHDLDLEKDVPDKKTDVHRSVNEDKSKTLTRKEADQNTRLCMYSKNKNIAGKYKHNLIIDETPPCYSLSSSLSSLSDMDLEDQEKTQLCKRAKRQLTLNRMRDIIISKTLNGHACCERDSSPSSLSLNSEDDLLQKCISSAMPKKRRHSARKRNAERKQKIMNMHKNKPTDKDWKPDLAHHLSDENMSDKASDLDSVEWKAIQEGANSIVNWLHQAAVSLSREPSSESDSILSFMSGLSVGSPLRLNFDMKEKKRIQKEVFQKEGNASRKKEHVRGSEDKKKEAEKKTNGNRNSRADKNISQNKQIPNLPVVFRGRTVIYMPKESASPRSTPKKTAKNDAFPQNSNQLQQRSRSLHRLEKSTELADLSLQKRSATPPARISKGPSSGSSRNSTPSRQPQKKLTSPSQINKQLTGPGTRSNGSIPEKKCNPAVSTTTKSDNKSPGPKNKTQKSPVRIPFMQTPTKKVIPQRNNSSPLINQFNRQKQNLNGKNLQPTRLDLVRMSSARSSGSESDKSGFLRQLTFIKESSSHILRQRSEISSSESLSSLSRCASPRKSKSDIPAVFLCSSRCQELKVAKPVMPNHNVTLSKTTTSSDRKHPKRTSSESPSRPPVKNNPMQREILKRHSSFPHINMRKRTNSPSVFSSFSESCDKAKGDVEYKPEQKPRDVNGKQSQQKSAQGMWRRIRDEDVPHILKSTLPSSALPLVNNNKSEQQLSNKQNVIQRKTSDAVVQTEDFLITKTNSSTSPTLETTPPVSAEASKKVTATSFVNESTPSGVGPFHSSRHSSPSRAVKVTPFNYIPSPMATSSQTSQIQVPTMNEKPMEKVEM
ncbi:adenomatous polyposis coli protein 2 [Latimeria chalumnae]|uniref:adenomatous polyposis coli protein 2 n=1 Tax=Latimeria chalumnae TaxID=7897 RepID=UPI00313AF4B0